MLKKYESKKLSVILPTLNEADNLKKLIAELTKTVSSLEIIIVDDNSEDKTQQVIEDLKLKYPNLLLMKNNSAIGLTASIQKGINIASGNLIAWMDADFSHPPKTLKIMLSKMDKFDIAVGSWLTKGGHDARSEYFPKLMSFLINKICRFIFNPKLTSYTSGFVIAKRKVFKNFNLTGEYGEYFIDFLVNMNKKGFRIIEVPFTCISRRIGTSKTYPNPIVYFKRGTKYLKIIYNLKLTKV